MAFTTPKILTSRKQRQPCMEVNVITKMSRRDTQIMSKDNQNFVTIADSCSVSMRVGEGQIFISVKNLKNMHFLSSKIE